MYWPCRPLEIEGQNVLKGGRTDDRRASQRWLVPSALDLLHDTPINCLVVPWFEGSPQDADHQVSLKPLIDAGRARGLKFVGLVKGTADRESLVSSAVKAGLSGLAIESWTGGNTPFPVIPWLERHATPGQNPSPVLAVTKTVWPGIKGNWHSLHDTADAGPTGSPWVNSNGWLIQLIQAMTPSQQIWVVSHPPDQEGGVYPDAYLLAVADAAAYGARWVISLDYPLQTALLDGRKQAVETWQRIISTVRFFERHLRWNEFRPGGVLGILSDFSGDNEFFSEELLNLTSRRQLPFRIVEKTRSQPGSLAGLKAVLYADQSPPNNDLRQQMLSFSGDGGLLVSLPVWGRPEGTFQEDTLDGRFSLYRYGRGFLAMAKESEEDPYQLAAQVHLLLGRRNDLVRIWNGPALGVYLRESAEARNALVGLLDYSGRGQSDAVSLWLKNDKSAARLWTLQCKGSVLIHGDSTQEGTEFHLPRFSLYAALEVD
jgi:hypothetical protein